MNVQHNRGRHMKFDSFKNNDGRLPLFRTQVALARDAADILGILIQALEKEFPTIAHELSLTNETNEKVETLVDILGNIDRVSISRQIHDVDEISALQNEAANLYEKLREQIAEFMNKAPSISDPLERKNLIQGLMKDCVKIIEEAFPGIHKDIELKKPKIRT